MDVKKNERNQPVPVPNTSGYPNNIASTQTVKVRGTGAQTKATKSTKKLG